MPDLIVNADDFGRTAEVSRGILESHKKGIVTSTTTMVNYPTAAAAVETAMADAPMLGLGLHLNLTSGPPVSDPAAVPSLVQADGRFHPAPGLAPFAIQWQPEDIARELTAQLERFQALTGKLPTHLDSHHHSVYMYPASLQVMLDLARAHNLPIRRVQHGATPAETAKSWLLVALPNALEVASELHALVDANPNIRMPAYFAGGFYGDHANLGELLTILTNLPADGLTELMCHPGYVGDLDSSYNVEREAEIKWLTYPSTHEVIVAESIRLITFAELA
jgi:predicted glycoside hydrolase/deacetylase ChbG (UPF0249 family)